MHAVLSTFDFQHHFIREAVEAKPVVLKHIRASDQAADVFENDVFGFDSFANKVMLDINAFCTIYGAQP